MTHFQVHNNINYISHEGEPSNIQCKLLIEHENIL